MEVAHRRERFDCHQCRNNKHCDDSNPAPFPMFAIPDIGLESRTCLLPMLTPFSHLMMRLFAHYKEQRLPLAGGVLEQPNVYLEAMEAIEARQARILSEQKQDKHGHYH